MNMHFFIIVVMTQNVSNEVTLFYKWFNWP